MSRRPHPVLALAVVLHLVSISDGRAEEARISPKVRDYAELSRRMRPAAIAAIGEQVAAARTRLSEVRRSRYSTTDEKVAAIAKAQRRLDSLIAQRDKVENPFEPFFAPSDPREFDIGSIGRVEWRHPPSGKYRGGEPALVFQIVDESNMIVELSWIVPSYKIRGEIGEQTAIETLDIDTKLIWVSGLPTDTLVEGDFPGDSNQVFQITRSKNYQTATGSNAILMFERVNVGPFASLFTLADEAREWTDSSGKHKFTAIYVKHEKGKVRLIGEDRKPRDVSMSRLSEADQEYVREKMQELRRSAPK